MGKVLGIRIDFTLSAICIFFVLFFFCLLFVTKANLSRFPGVFSFAKLIARQQDTREREGDRGIESEGDSLSEARRVRRVKGACQTCVAREWDTKTARYMCVYACVCVSACVCQCVGVSPSVCVHVYYKIVQKRCHYQKEKRAKTRGSSEQKTYK